MSSSLRISLLIVLACTACSAPLPPVPPDANRLAPDHAPTPFTAAEIRAACPDGRIIRSAITAGMQKTQQTTRFEGGDTEGTTIVMQSFDLRGTRAAPEQRVRARWDELQKHASFPAADTRITPFSKMTAVGRRDGWNYDVRFVKDNVLHHSRYSFARDLPGPPIEVTQSVDGIQKYHMVMIENGTGTGGNRANAR